MHASVVTDHSHDTADGSVHTCRCMMPDMYDEEPDEGHIVVAEH